MLYSTYYSLSWMFLKTLAPDCQKIITKTNGVNSSYPIVYSFKTPRTSLLHILIRTPPSIENRSYISRVVTIKKYY